MYNRYCPKCGSPNINDDDVFDFSFKYGGLDSILAKVSATCDDCGASFIYNIHYKFDKYSDFELCE